jgi:hypothetical protein
MIRINEIFSEIVNYLGNYLEGVSSIGLVSSIQVVLNVSISNIKDIVYISILICEVVGINLEFANNLDVPVVIGRTNTIVELYWIRDLSGTGLIILIAFLFD